MRGAGLSRNEGNNDKEDTENAKRVKKLLRRLLSHVTVVYC